MGGKENHYIKQDSERNTTCSLLYVAPRFTFIFKSTGACVCVCDEMRKGTMRGEEEILREKRGQRENNGRKGAIDKRGGEGRTVAEGINDV